MQLLTWELGKISQIAREKCDIYTHTHKYVFRSSQVLWTAFKVVPRRRVYRFSAEVRILTPAEESSACELDGYETKEIREPLRDCEIVVEFGGSIVFVFERRMELEGKKKQAVDLMRRVFLVQEARCT